MRETAQHIFGTLILLFSEIGEKVRRNFDERAAFAFRIQRTRHGCDRFFAPESTLVSFADDFDAMVEDRSDDD